MVYKRKHHCASVLSIYMVNSWQNWRKGLYNLDHSVKCYIRDISGKNLSQLQILTF